MSRCILILLATVTASSVGDEGRAEPTGRPRLPGVFANYTTWCFETEGGLVHRLRFELRSAN